MKLLWVTWCVVSKKKTTPTIEADQPEKYKLVIGSWYPDGKHKTKAGKQSLNWTINSRVTSDELKPIIQKAIAEVVLPSS